MPALLLQPIVENAIRHGLAARLDAGRIDIEARVDGGTLRLVVTDDGSADDGEVDRRAASASGSATRGRGSRRSMADARGWI